METLIYLAKASILLSVFLLIYRLLLSKESFIQWNRIFLVLGLVLSFSLPLVTYTQIEITEIEIPIQRNTNEPTIQFIENEIPMANTSQVKSIEQASFWDDVRWIDILISVYLLGVLFFLGKLIHQSFSLIGLLHKAKKIRKKGICYCEANQQMEAFSFFNTMVYNPKLHDENELKIIKTHEEIHIKEWHSIDMLLGNLACISLWFLPFVYRYRTAIDENLEYIADAKTAQKTKSVKKYQYTLLNYLALDTNMQYASYFFKQSSLKNRIMMLNKEKSNTKNMYKYSLILPFIIGFIWLFQIETLAKEVYVEVEHPTQTNTSGEASKSEAELADVTFQDTNEKVIKQDSTSVTTIDNIEVTINKNSTDKSLDNLSDFFAKHEQKLKFSKIKRNNKGEIKRIKIVLFDTENGFKKELLVSGNDPIQDYVIRRNFKNNIAEIVEWQEPEKDLYTLLNEAKTIIINGKEFESSKPLAITDVKVKHIDDELIELTAKELSETNVDQITNMYEDENNEQIVYIFNYLNQANEKVSKVIRMHFNKPKNRFVDEFSHAYNEESNKEIETSSTDELSKGSNEDSNLLSVKTTPNSSIKEKIEDKYKTVDYIYINDEKINKRSLIDKILVYKTISFNNQELAFSDAKLYENENHNSIGNILVQVIKQEKEMNKQQVLWFRTSEDVELASVHNATIGKQKEKLEEPFGLSNNSLVSEVKIIKNGKKPIYVLNGKITTAAEFDKINPQSIDSVSVFKNYDKLPDEIKSNTFIKKEDFPGAIFVQLNENNDEKGQLKFQGKLNVNDADGITKINAPDIIMEYDDGKPPIFILKEKVIDKETFKLIRKTDIKSIFVMKDFENLSTKLKNIIGVKREDFNGLILIELKDEKEKNKFEIIVSKTKNGYAMKCNQGCAWKELTFSLAKDEVRYVDASGVSSTEFTTQLDDLPEFQFKVEEENNLIKLTKLSGSIWEDLGFSIQVNETYKLTNYGVNKI